MKKYNRILFVCLFIIVIISCDTKVKCPDFDVKVLEWFPYHLNDTINLIKETGDSSITLIIDNVDIDHVTEYSRNTDCGGCGDRITFGKQDNEESNLYVTFNSNNNVITSENYNIKGCYFDNYYSNYSLKENYTFDGTIYNEVKLFERKTKDKFYTQLLIAKSKGIIGLIDINGNKWILDKGFLIKQIPPVIQNRTGC